MPDARPIRILPGCRRKKPRARGALRMFFGYAAGVGKTFAMLRRAASSAEGVVVAGYVEPHGRPETEALLEGLEIAALPVVVDYRGVKLREFDLDAALTAVPMCCWWTSWPTPTPKAAGTPSAGRTSRSCSTPASTCTPRSTSSTSKA